MKVLKSQNNNRIAKIWVDDLAKVESQTLDQIRLMLEFPALFKHIAVMPDTHLGKGAVIGGVVATKNTVVPNIVGVDIGCGMSAYRTQTKFNKDKHNKEFWMLWKSTVDRAVPAGFNSHKDAKNIGELDRQLSNKKLMDFMPRAKRQMGTLGGGNHFLEAQVDGYGYIWFMVHSGSRHMGLQIANYHNKVAKEFNTKYFSNTPQDLWFLRLDNESGKNYLEDMEWAIEFALESRWRMLEEMVSAFFNVDSTKDGLHQVRKNGINIHHNFASIENHFGENVVIHRKGATQARNGQIGIIPGSMGTNSYIVVGKGNPESYHSCSHGAGRTMSRSEAKRTFTSEQIKESLKDTFTKPSTKFIDEAPMAYKDIEEVMANQADLVEITHTLRPIITIKG